MEGNFAVAAQKKNLHFGVYECNPGSELKEEKRIWRG